MTFPHHTYFTPLPPGGPDPPSNIYFTEVTANSALIHWTASEDDGGSPITGYNILLTNGRQTRNISTPVVTQFRLVET